MNEPFSIFCIHRRTFFFSMSSNLHSAWWFCLSSILHPLFSLCVPSYSPPFPVSLFCFFHLTLSCPAIGQSTSLVNQPQRNLHNVQNDYSTACIQFYFYANQRITPGIIFVCFIGFLFCFVFLKQDLFMYFWLAILTKMASDSQNSSFLFLPSAAAKGMHYHIIISFKENMKEICRNFHLFILTLIE